MPRLALLGLLLVLASFGCASEERYSARPVYQDASLDDGCQSFLDSSYHMKGYYYALACANMITRIMMAEQSGEPHPTRSRRCFPDTRSYVEGGLEDSIQTYYAQDPTQPLSAALDSHWAKSVNRGAFY